MTQEPLTAEDAIWRCERCQAAYFERNKRALAERLEGRCVACGGSAFTKIEFTLADRLRLQGVEQVKFVKEPRGTHDEASWARRLPDALRWIYSEQA